MNADVFNAVCDASFAWAVDDILAWVEARRLWIVLVVASCSRSEPTHLDAGEAGTGGLQPIPLGRDIYQAELWKDRLVSVPGDIVSIDLAPPHARRVLFQHPPDSDRIELATNRDTLAWTLGARGSRGFALWVMTLDGAPRRLGNFDLPSPERLVVDADDVFVLFEDPPRSYHRQLMAVPRSGGALRRIASGQLHCFAIDKTHVYWASSGVLHRAAKDGATRDEVLAWDTWPGAIYASETQLFLFNRAWIHAISKSTWQRTVLHHWEPQVTWFAIREDGACWVMADETVGCQLGDRYFTIPGAFEWRILPGHGWLTWDIDGERFVARIPD